MDENNDLTLQYQEILNKYSQEMSQSAKLPAESPTTTPSTESPLSSTPLVTDQVNPVAEPETPTHPAPIIRTPTPLPPPPLLIKPERQVNVFKYFFYFSLLVFLGVVGMIGYTFVNNQSLNLFSSSTPTPIALPTNSEIKYCETNDQKVAAGQSFPATDGCNTCTCGTDLTISCTEKVCEAPTPTVVPLTPKKQKLPTDLVSFIKFQTIKLATTPIKESDIVIGESVFQENYATVSVSQGIIIWAAKHDNAWTYITSGQEPAKCSILSAAGFPPEFGCNP